jgi:hypothetical protein
VGHHSQRPTPAARTKAHADQTTGIIPGAGDVANIALNYTLVLRPAKKLDIPQSLEAHMFFNNAVSAGVGFVPIVGDVALAAWKANWRNAALLEEFLRKRGEENIAAGQKSGLSEMSDPQQAKLASKFIGVFGGTSTPIPPEGDAAVNGNGDSAAGTSASATVAATTTTDPKASTNGKHRKSHSLSRRKHDAQVAEVGAPQPSEAGATAGDSEAAEADEKNQNKNKNKLKFW